MGVWKGVAMDSLKFNPDQPCPTLICPASRLSLKLPYSRFRGGEPTGQGCVAVFYPFGYPAPYAYRGRRIEIQNLMVRGGQRDA
jgi:hypothetical protein